MSNPRRSGTLAEIARECGVAISTVSYVLRGKHREARISETRAQQILAAARKLDYRPNAAAVAMRRGRFNAIGLAISEIPGRQSVFPEMLDGLLQQSRSRDLHLVMGMLSDEQFDARGPLPRILREWSIDGLLINYLFDFPPELERALEEHQLPSIWVNAKRQHDCVYPDDDSAAASATQYLIDLGHRRIAFMTGNCSGHYSHADRRLAYERTMTAAGLTPSCPVHGTFIDRWDRVAAFLPVFHGPNRPTAIITYEMDDALAAYTAAHQAGLQIPRDCSLIGIHDRQIDTLGLAITTWLIPAADLATHALELITEKIGHPDKLLQPRALPFGRALGVTTAPPPAP